MRTLTFFSSGESAATPLWEECDDETHTPEMGTWESTGTLKILEFDSRLKTTHIVMFFISLESY